MRRKTENNAPADSGTVSACVEQCHAMEFCYPGTAQIAVSQGIMSNGGFLSGGVRVEITMTESSSDGDSYVELVLRHDVALRLARQLTAAGRMRD